MNMKMLLLVLLVISAFALGCAQSGPPTGYSTYGGAQGGQQQYVGGGCGLAPIEAGSDVSLLEIAPSA